MSIGRRKIRLENEGAWIFNRMVEAYEFRPAYPEALIDFVAQLACSPNGRVADIGAGMGHLAVPLAQRGLGVTAIEPAKEMLERLKERADEMGVSLKAIHGVAEALAVPDGGCDLALVSDAIHFLDIERSANELSRILAPRGAIALVTCGFTPTPFMSAVDKLMQQAAPRRPRDVSAAVAQLLSVVGIQNTQRRVFLDETSVSRESLEGILRSISFIGPAMNRERYAAFREKLHTIEHESIWARTFTVFSGKRRR